MYLKNIHISCVVIYSLQYLQKGDKKEVCFYGASGCFLVWVLTICQRTWFSPFSSTAYRHRHRSNHGRGAGTQAKEKTITPHKQDTVTDGILRQIPMDRPRIAEGSGHIVSGQRLSCETSSSMTFFSY